MATRREFLAAAGVGAAGLAIGAGATAFFEEESGGGSSTGHADPFHGEHQAGIATAAQDKLVFAAFDTTLATKAELRDLFRQWTKAAALMTAGQPVAPAGGDLNLPPADTGEALGLGPAELTVTFGLGGELFAPALRAVTSLVSTSLGTESSSTPRPSPRRMIRSQKLATTASWVATNTVLAS